MKQRCENPKHVGYPRYGGRGITICEAWRSFDQFLRDMGPRPSRRHSLDRIDNNGNYEPGNCRWATASEQHRNTRVNVRLTWNGSTRTVAEWAEILNVRRNTLYQRVDAGWTDEQVLSHPFFSTNREVLLNRPGNRKLTFKGESLTITEWGEKLGIRPNTLVKRLRNGWSVERTLSEKVVRK